MKKPPFLVISTILHPLSRTRGTVLSTAPRACRLTVQTMVLPEQEPSVLAELRVLSLPEPLELLALLEWLQREQRVLPAPLSRTPHDVWPC